MPTTTRNPWVWAAVILTLFKLWLTRGQAIYAIGNAQHDDRLFLELAAHLLHGDWLGPYDQLTLAKGPLYSVFIASTFLLGLPLGLAQQICYAVACAVVVRSALPVLRSAAFAFAAYALMLANPLTYEGESLTRLLRQHLLVPLVMLVAAGLIALLLRRKESFRARLPWATLAGLALGGVWLTREETVWIFSIILVLGSAIAFHAWRGGAAARRTAAGLGVVMVVGCALPLLIVCSLNFRHYGWFGTVEFRSRDFKNAYGALTRVQVGPAYSNVPVSREMRTALYRVSPAFAELQPYFEGPNHPWANDEFFPIADHQILGGWFMWALRDAVVHAGHGHSARESLAFYRRLAEEVNRACDDGRLPARPPRSGLLPPWHPDYLRKLRAEFWPYARYFLWLPRFESRPPYSVGTDDQLRLFRELTHDELSPAPDATFIELPRVVELNRTRLEWLVAIGRPVLGAMFYAVLVALALAVVRLTQCVRQRQFPDSFVIALGAWAAFCGAWLVNFLVHVTSLFTQYPAMVAPAYCFLPIVVIFTARDVTLAWGGGGWLSLRQKFSRHANWFVVFGAATFVLAARGQSNSWPHALFFSAMTAFAVHWLRRSLNFWTGLGATFLWLTLLVFARPPEALNAAVGAASLPQFLATWFAWLGWPTTWVGACVLVQFPLIALGLRLPIRGGVTAFDHTVRAMGIGAAFATAVLVLYAPGDSAVVSSVQTGLLAAGLLANALACLRFAGLFRWLGLLWLGAVGFGLWQNRLVVPWSGAPAALATAGALVAGVGCWSAWRTRGSLRPTLPPIAGPINAARVAAVGLFSASLLLLWPMPLEFRADRRRETLLSPAGTVADLKFHLTETADFTDGRLTGAAGISNEQLRNNFYGTHVNGPGDLVQAASEPFAISGPYLVVPVAGFPDAAGNRLFVRIIDGADRPLAELEISGVNFREIGFWRTDVRAFQGRRAQLVLIDRRASAEGWLAVAPPRFSAQPSEADQLTREWELERSTPARWTLLAIASLCSGWLGFRWILRRRALA